VPNLFQYSGEMWDETAGLQYLRARWYDPSIGRFMNEDTYEGDIVNPLSQNLYTYVGNNPLTRVDPTGHCYESWVTPTFGTCQYGAFAHKALGMIFDKINILNDHKVAFVEPYITLEDGSKGRADYVLNIEGDIYEVYELKPISYRTNKSLNKSGKEQLQGYIDGINENGFKGNEDAVALAGTSWNPNGLTVPSPFDPNKKIKYYTYADEPGMIYYAEINNPNPVKAPVTEKAGQSTMESLWDWLKSIELPSAPLIPGPPVNGGKPGGVIVIPA